MALRFYTAHLKPGCEPVLVREGWSWGAFLFGPLWLLARRAWIPAALDIALLLLVPALLPGPIGLLVTAALAILTGLLGRDLVRWSLERRRYTLAHVMAASDEEAALARLLTARPDLARAMATPS